LIDRLSKLHVVKNYNEATHYINDYINLDLIWNTGIGFGFLSTDSYLLYHSVTFLIGLVVLILIYVAVKLRKTSKLIFSVIIAGALGNFYDRLIYNAVPDFIDLHFNSFHWFTFNVADIFITIGVVFLLFNDLLIKND